jgi:tetratricopeptide (TPR) repeat protein
MNKAQGYYEQAIALDPRYALAVADYATFLIGRAAMGFSPMREMAPRSRSLAQRALQLDGSLREAHAILCRVAAAYDYDWQEAGRQFVLATQGGQASPLVHFNCGTSYLLGSGRLHEALEQLTLAVRGDPVDALFRAHLALNLDALGRHDEAGALLQQVLELDADFIVAWLYAAIVKAGQEEFAEALTFAEKAYSLMPSMSNVVGLYAGLLVCTGERDLGNEIIQALGAGDTYGTAKGLANFHILCGEFDAAANWFEKGILERDPAAPIHLQAGLGRSLLATPHWPRLAALMNLPAETRT